MFTRNRELIRAPGIIREEIKLAPGETEQGRFDAWLKDKLATPRFCRSHPRTQLVPDRAASNASPAYEKGCFGYPGPGPETKSGVFDFKSVLRCPACRCAYALCPPGLHETSFETFATFTPEHKSALERCRAYVAQVNQHERGFALFVGPTGTRKTGLACNIVRELQNLDALYVRQGELTIALRATYGRKDVYMHRRQRTDDEDEDDPTTPLEIVQAVSILILDELGCNPLANDERLLLDELIKHRYDAGKPTILISNLPLDQLKEFLGDALTDRVKHATGSGKFILQFSGESFRRTAGENYLTGNA